MEDIKYRMNEIHKVSLDAMKLMREITTYHAVYFVLMFMLDWIDWSVSTYGTSEYSYTYMVLIVDIIIFLWYIIGYIMNHTPYGVIKPDRFIKDHYGIEKNKLLREYGNYAKECINDARNWTSFEKIPYWTFLFFSVSASLAQIIIW